MLITPNTNLKNHTRWPLLFAIVVLAVLASGCAHDKDKMQMGSDSGQCWSMKGGVGKLLKNSSTKDECKELGGKSWCPVGGGCENL